MLVMLFYLGRVGFHNSSDTALFYSVFNSCIPNYSVVCWHSPAPHLPHYAIQAPSKARRHYNASHNTSTLLHSRCFSYNALRWSAGISRYVSQNSLSQGSCACKPFCFPALGKCLVFFLCEVHLHSAQLSFLWHSRTSFLDFSFTFTDFNVYHRKKQYISFKKSKKFFNKNQTHARTGAWVGAENRQGA